MKEEAKIQKQIIDTLRKMGWFCFKVNNGGVYIKKIDRYMKSPMPGVSDIIGIKDGRMLCCEVKSKNGVLSDEQKIFLENIRLKGGIGICVRSIDEMLKQIK